MMFMNFVSHWLLYQLLSLTLSEAFCYIFPLLCISIYNTVPLFLYLFFLFFTYVVNYFILVKWFCRFCVDTSISVFQKYIFFLLACFSLFINVCCCIIISFTRFWILSLRILVHGLNNFLVYGGVGKYFLNKTAKLCPLADFKHKVQNFASDLRH